MKILDKEYIYKADEFSIKEQNITSDILMERAGKEIFSWLHKKYVDQKPMFHIFCGSGNNGGDGLVVARHLQLHEYEVKTYIIGENETCSSDFELNFDRLKKAEGNFYKIEKNDDFPEIRRGDIIIDAIFGIGLNRPLTGEVKHIVKKINSYTKNTIIAIDVPSGLALNIIPKVDWDIIHADFTLTFQVPKLIFFLPSTSHYVGVLKILDISLSKKFINTIQSDKYYIGKNEAQQLLKSRAKFSNKGTYGHALIIGGSYGKIGAPLMSSKACLYSGVGLVSLYVPKCGYQIIQTAFPEAMVLTDDSEAEISEIEYTIKPSVIGIGMGMGQSENTVKAFKKFLEDNTTPLVVDADGLNILSKNNDLLKLLPKQTILTPHPKELQRLIGKWENDFEKIEKVKAFSKQYNIIMVCKDAVTITIYENELYVNSTGNPGMATGGTGDTLTGIITGLLSQKYEAVHAAILGVYLHGLAGDFVAKKVGFEALTATMLIDKLGKAYKTLYV
ncbi:NAD(P)H-hydrate dehydratase [Zhouia sp. PK063]|uniref:NAD(P)H-hydrate dehydratase n=1 Tax=Zhouia sp. PK063 TaxID=3373602 RepID=UPI00379EDB09